MRCTSCASKSGQYVCGQCKRVVYCNTKCQRNDYARHANVCFALVEGKKRERNELTDEQQRALDTFETALTKYKRSKKNKEDIQTLRSAYEKMDVTLRQEYESTFMEAIPCIYNKDMIQIPKAPMTADMPGLLFVDKEYARGKDWVKKTQASMTTTTLYLKDQEVPVLNEISNNDALTPYQKRLLIGIYDREKTMINNGWQKISDDTSIDVLSSLVQRKWITDDLLEYFLNEWCGNLTVPPVYNYNANGFTYSPLSDHYMSKLDWKPVEKARIFMSDAIKFSLQTTLEHISELLGGVNTNQCFFLFTPQVLQLEKYNILADKCATPQEFFWCVTLAQHILKKDVEKLLPFVKTYFDNDVPYELKKTYTAVFVKNGANEKGNDGNTSYDIIYDTIKDWREQQKQKKEKNMPARLPILSKKHPHVSFLLSYFITYSFQVEWKNQDAEEFFAQLGVTMRDTPVINAETQMVEIVVNEGTSKDIINSQLTELVQNSVDAITQKKPNDKSVRIELGIQDDCIVLSVTDYIGIDVNSLIALSIPFYSEKGGQPGLVGEMGTGFFNVYRSEKVFIETSRDGHVFFIEDTPIKDTNKRVIDIHRKISYYFDKKTENRTTITIKSYKMQDIEQSIFLNKARNFVKHTLGLIRGEIYLDNSLITTYLSEKTTTLYSEYCVVDKGFIQKSYVLTKGVPFVPLQQFLAQEIEHSKRNMELDTLVETKFGERNSTLLKEMGETVYPVSDLLSHSFMLKDHVLNFKSGSYTPVQTRSSITLTTLVRVSMWKYMLDYLYESILNSLEYQRNQYFVFYNSRGSSVDQVLPTKASANNNIQNFAMNYVLNDVSFIDLLHHIVTEYTKKVETLEYNVYFSDVTKIEYPPGNEKLLRIAQDWTKGKRVKTELEQEMDRKRQEDFKAQQEDDTGKEDEIETLKKSTDYIIIIECLQLWVETYIDIGKKLYIFSSDIIVPKVETSPYGNSQFQLNNNTIHFKIDQTTYKEHIDIFQKIKEGSSEKLHDSKLFIKFYGNAGTVAHELEHVRRRSSHTGKAPHDPIITKFPDEQQQSMNFDVCHIYTMQKILQCEFYSELSKKLTTLIKKEIL
jgi:MYND finger